MSENPDPFEKAVANIAAHRSNTEQNYKHRRASVGAFANQWSDVVLDIMNRANSTLSAAYVQFRNYDNKPDAKPWPKLSVCIEARNGYLPGERPKFPALVIELRDSDKVVATAASVGFERELPMREKAPREELQQLLADYAEVAVTAPLPAPNS